MAQPVLYQPALLRMLASVLRCVPQGLLELPTCALKLSNGKATASSPCIVQWMKVGKQSSNTLP